MSIEETTINASPLYYKDPMNDDVESLGFLLSIFNDDIESPSVNYLYDFTGSSLPQESNEFLAHDVSLVDMIGVKDDAGCNMCFDDVCNFNLEKSHDTMYLLDSEQVACVPSCWPEISNMGDNNMEVVILPHYVMHQDNFIIGLKLIFSTSHIQISDEALSIELAVGDLVEINSQLFRSNEPETVKMELCVFDSGTSGIKKWIIGFVDSNWSLTLNNIKSLNLKYSAIWKTATEVDVECNENFSCGPTSYFPNFDEVVYPKGDPDAVSLSKRDVDLLQPDTYINDTLIDFYIQYLKNKIPKEEHSRFHFFNSFFFRKLADMDKDPSSASDGEAAFLRVRKWTRKVNIFEKDYIFIPVNFNLHWSLIVICHPGEVVHFNDKELDKSPRVPCILHMDSAKGLHGGHGLENLVRSYLNEEWKERHKNTCGEDILSRFLNMRFHPVAVPQQQNDYDCGLFLLHYLELFLAEAPYNFNPSNLEFSNFLNLEWFQPAEAHMKRTLIQWLILELVVNNGSHEGFSSDDSGDRRCSENNGESSTSHSGEGIEMTVLPASSSSSSSSSSSPVLKELFEPGVSLGHSQEETDLLEQRMQLLQIVDVNMETETHKRSLFDCDRDLMMGPSRKKPKIWKVYTRRAKRGPNREKPKINRVNDKYDKFKKGKYYVRKKKERRAKRGPNRERPKINSVNDKYDKFKKGKFYVRKKKGSRGVTVSPVVGEHSSHN